MKKMFVIVAAMFAYFGLLAWAHPLMFPLDDIVPVAHADTEPFKPAPDLSGIYELQGTTSGIEGAELESYAGICIIRKKGDGYVMQWTVGPGANAIGLGAFEDGIFTCSWALGPRLGMTRYKVEQGGKKLVGKWMAVPSCKWEQETLVRMSDFPKAKDVKQTALK